MTILQLESGCLCSAAHAGLSSFEAGVCVYVVCVVVKVERKYNNAVQSTETLPNIS